MYPDKFGLVNVKDVVRLAVFKQEKLFRGFFYKIIGKRQQIGLLLFAACCSDMPDYDSFPVFNLIHLNGNRIGSVFYLPDFVHFDPLGQQITKNKNLNNTLSTAYTLYKLWADKSGKDKRQH